MYGVAWRDKACLPFSVPARQKGAKGRFMTQILASLAEVSDRYDAVFCDLWGCVHNGNEPFPAAVAALQAFRARGGKVILITNAPRPKSSIVKQLDKMGCPRDCWDDIVSSGDAAQYAMLTGAVGRKVYFIGAPQHDSFFTSLSPDLEAVAKREPMNASQNPESRAAARPSERPLSPR